MITVHWAWTVQSRLLVKTWIDVQINFEERNSLDVRKLWYTNVAVNPFVRPDRTCWVRLTGLHAYQNKIRLTPFPLLMIYHTDDLCVRLHCDCHIPSSSVFSCSTVLLLRLRSYWAIVNDLYPWTFKELSHNIPQLISFLMPSTNKMNSAFCMH